ncbi:hypothetical protein ACVWY0_003215 [Arthrobacter sp. UYNi723]
MTEQPVETEEQFLGNAPAQRHALAGDHVDGILARHILQCDECASFRRQAEFYLTDQATLQHYAPNAHRTPYKLYSTVAAAELPAADATFITRAKQADLWLDAEEQATRALAEIQDGNINAGIACLQAALAFAQNYRHSLTEEVAR